MNINFSQGIISYPSVGNQQTFLTSAGGYVSLSTANGPTDIAFAHGNTTYLVTESSDVSNAWGPLISGTTYWLYWDINTTSAVLTYGVTTLTPVVSSSRPNGASDGQHWFDTVNKKMNVFQAGRWREVIRVFAAAVNGNAFVPLGSGFPLKPYAGTQVGLSQDNILAGRIIIDNVGKPIRRVDGRFFTTEDDFFVNGSPINSIRLESGIVIATAGSNLAKFQVVKYTDFNTVVAATYNDTEETAIGIMMTDVLAGGTGSLCIQGLVTNPSWSWSTVGANLWITTGGTLTETDPHVASPLTNSTAKAAVGRVLSPTSIIFDQGLGGRGEQGKPGVVLATLATELTPGYVRLSVAAATVGDPVVVGDNDPRNTNARVPLSHNQAATTITTTPVGTLTGTTADAQLSQLESHKLDKAGGTMTGPLLLATDPTVALQSATKQYVDAHTFPVALDNLTDVVITTPTTGQALTYNGTNWVNSASGGGDSLWTVDSTLIPGQTSFASHRIQFVDLNTGMPFTDLGVMLAATLDSNTNNYQLILNVDGVDISATLTGDQIVAGVGSVVDALNAYFNGTLIFTPVVTDGASYIDIASIVPNVPIIINSTYDGNVFVAADTDTFSGINNVVITDVQGVNIPDVTNDVLTPAAHVPAYVEIDLNTVTHINANTPIIPAYTPDWVAETAIAWSDISNQFDTGTGILQLADGSILTAGYATSTLTGNGGGYSAELNHRYPVAASTHDGGERIDLGNPYTGRLLLTYDALSGAYVTAPVIGAIKDGPQGQVALVTNMLMRSLQTQYDSVYTISVVKLDISQPISSDWLSNVLEIGYKPTNPPTAGTPFVNYKPAYEGGTFGLEVDQTTGDIYVAAPYGLYAEDVATPTLTESGIHIMKIDPTGATILWEVYLQNQLQISPQQSCLTLTSAGVVAVMKLDNTTHTIMRFDKATGATQCAVDLLMPAGAGVDANFTITSLQPFGTDVYISGYTDLKEYFIARLTSTIVSAMETYNYVWFRRYPAVRDSLSPNLPVHAVANANNVFVVMPSAIVGNADTIMVSALTHAGVPVWSRAIKNTTMPVPFPTTWVNVIMSSSSLPINDITSIYSGIALTSDAILLSGSLEYGRFQV